VPRVIASCISCPREIEVDIQEGQRAELIETIIGREPHRLVIKDRILVIPEELRDADVSDSLLGDRSSQRREE